LGPKKVGPGGGTKYLTKATTTGNFTEGTTDNAASTTCFPMGS